MPPILCTGRIELRPAGPGAIPGCPPGSRWGSTAGGRGAGRDRQGSDSGRSGRTPAQCHGRRWPSGTSSRRCAVCESGLSSALQRYKSAIEAAPDLVDAYVRRGIRAHRRATISSDRQGLEIGDGVGSPKFMPNPSFAWQSLYGENRLGLTVTPQAYVASRSTSSNPGDGDLLFLVGVMLHVRHGEPERALKNLSSAGPLSWVVLKRHACSPAAVGHRSPARKRARRTGQCRDGNVSTPRAVLHGCRTNDCWACDLAVGGFTGACEACRRSCRSCSSIVCMATNAVRLLCHTTSNCQITTHSTLNWPPSNMGIPSRQSGVESFGQREPHERGTTGENP